MKEEPIYTKGKYALFAENDMHAVDPYEWDFEPPMMRFSGKGHYESIQRERKFDASDIIKLLEPKHCDTREKREKLLEIWDYRYNFIPLSGPMTGMEKDKYEAFLNQAYRQALRDCLDYKRLPRSIADTFCEYIKDQDFDEPYHSWSDAENFFDRLESLCEIVGIACINEQTNGYSQGDSYRVFMAATPEWLKETGLEGGLHDNLVASLMSSFKLWSAWCWGDCYAYVIKPIEVDEDGGTEYGDSVESCCGYYGNDLKASGLLEAGQSMIECLIEKDKKEAADAYEAACRDIATV